MVLIFKPELIIPEPVQLQADELNLLSVERASDSALIERIWYSQSERPQGFMSMAESHGEIVITRYEGHTTITIRGPETQASEAFCPPDAEFMGIVFKLGTFMPRFPASMVMNRHDVNLPQASSKSFWLDSSAWEIPTYENADSFVKRLIRAGLLVYDPLIQMTLDEKASSLSRRTVQRRFLQATGLTHKTIFQIQRARYATNLLKQGYNILDTTEKAGYADQAHLTRALKQLMGFTPKQIFMKNTEMPMSLLFNTETF